MKVYTGTGRRKTSVAAVRLVPGKGKFVINGRDAVDYLPIDLLRINALKPLDVAGQAGNFDVMVSVNGGGLTGQMGAIQLGVARALLGFDEELRGSFRKADLLTRDPRMVERKKYGQKKARKRFQFSKR